jgi:alkylation response protein AidB-like acyl-CoA dehydrogenase
MQTEFTEDQETFRETVTRFLQDKSQPADVRRLMETDSGYDPAVWKQLASEVGLAATHFPEEYGGYGFGPVELGIVSEAMGRYLYCGPFFASSVMAGHALLIAGSDSAKEKLLPEIAAGTLIATLVLDDLNEPDKVGNALSVSGGKLSGSAGLVVDGQNAACFIVIAREGAGLSLFLVDAGNAGVSIVPTQTLDPTRKLAQVSFANAGVESIGTVSAEALDQIWDHLCVALAHEMIGGAEHLLETTIEYTKVRYQFGRPIGSFQGLKHRAADLLLELECAKAATHHAAFCLAADEGEPYAASMAKAMASDAYMLAAREAIQMRGGIGFTWEEDTHLWFKRAKSSEVFMGTPAIHRARMMGLMENEA